MNKIKVKETKDIRDLFLIRDAFYFFVQDEFHINMKYASGLADKFLERLKVFEEKKTWAEVKKHYKNG